MSTERRSLQAWIGALVTALEDDPWGAAERLRDVVGGFTARISLDDETVVVSMPAGVLAWETELGAAFDGEGSTTTAVVIAIVDGQLEVTDAVARGLVQARGSPEAVLRLFHAVELILDASARVPVLRRLADEFRHAAGATDAEVAPESWQQARTDELALLQRIGVGRAR
jgi:hypothetical protein